MQNPNVSKITTIDPDTMAETVIFERKAGDEIIFWQNETLLKTGKWNEIINKLEKDGSKIRVSGSCKNPVLPTGNGYCTFRRNFCIKSGGLNGYRENFE